MEFINQLCSGEIGTYKWDISTPVPEMKIKSAELFTAYKEWISETGERSCGSDRSFSGELKNEGILKKGLRFDEITTKGYHLKKPDMIILFTKLLCMEDFRF
jgi:hypothetical protein